jgi:hypothetical protein
MQTRFLLLLSFVFVLGLTACQENVDVDPNYPTTIEQLTDSQIDELYDVVYPTSLYGCALLDDFGHFETNIKDDDLCVYNDSVEASYTEDELVLLSKQAVASLQSFFEVDDTASLQLNEIVSMKGRNYSSFIETSFPPVWKITFDPQVYDGLKVRGTEITVLINSDGVFSLKGNWYSDIYIPSTNGVELNEAEDGLVGEKLTYGSSSIRITNDTYWRSTSKVIVPIHRSESIELRVCWVLYTGNWEILIDSQDGDQISVVDFDEL